MKINVTQGIKKVASLSEIGIVPLYCMNKFEKKKWTTRKFADNSLISKLPFPCNQIPHKGSHRNNMTANCSHKRILSRSFAWTQKPSVFHLLPLLWLAVLLTSNSDSIKIIEAGIKKGMGRGFLAWVNLQYSLLTSKYFYNGNLLGNYLY